MKEIEFSNEEKLRFFEKISNLYYKKNFGSVSKADFETLIFSEYIEHRLNAKESIDDYTLSKQLGVTQARIRSLKERKELKYPRSGFDWKESFASEIKSAKYISKDHSVKIIVQDINVMNEVRHYIEENGWYDECSLNKKMLTIPLACFTDIFLADDEIGELLTSTCKTELSKLGKEDSAVNTFLNDFTKKGLQNFLMSASKELLSFALNALPFGGIAKSAFDFLLEVIKKS